MTKGRTIKSKNLRWSRTWDKFCQFICDSTPT